MARGLSASMLTELTADTVRPRLLFEGVFSSTLRYWTGAYDVIWDSKTWLGDGTLKRVGSVTESAGLEPHSVEVELTGEPSAIISIALGGLAMNQQGSVWLAFLNTNGTFVADPYLLFQGLLDGAELDDSPDECTLTLSFESRLVGLEYAKEYTWDHETQQIFFPGDLGFEYVDQMKDWTGYWGKEDATKKPKTADRPEPKRKKEKKKKARRRKR